MAPGNDADPLHRAVGCTSVYGAEMTPTLQAEFDSKHALRADSDTSGIIGPPRVMQQVDHVAVILFLAHTIDKIHRAADRPTDRVSLPQVTKLS